MRVSETDCLSPPRIRLCTNGRRRQEKSSISHPVITILASRASARALDHKNIALQDKIKKGSVGINATICSPLLLQSKGKRRGGVVR